MRHGTPNRRPRNNRPHNGGGHNGGQNNGQRRSGGAPNRNQIFDSNGPDVRIRGTAHQVCEKYLALAKDASSIGDIVLAESYMQHAEHYQRIINTWSEEFQGQQQPRAAFTPADGNQQPSQEDDLSLPISILGGDIQAPVEATVRSHTANADDMLEAV